MVRSSALRLAIDQVGRPARRSRCRRKCPNLPRKQPRFQHAGPLRCRLPIHLQVHIDQPVVRVEHTATGRANFAPVSRSCRSRAPDLPQARTCRRSPRGSRMPAGRWRSRLLRIEAVARRQNGNGHGKISEPGRHKPLRCSSRVFVRPPARGHNPTRYCTCAFRNARGRGGSRSARAHRSWRRRAR